MRVTSKRVIKKAPSTPKAEVVQSKEIEEKVTSSTSEIKPTFARGLETKWGQVARQLTESRKYLSVSDLKPHLEDVAEGHLRTILHHFVKNELAEVKKEGRNAKYRASKGLRSAVREAKK